MLQNVADRDLPALYAGAEVFAFPSSFEGFGLPPLEAMACGTPVVCSYAGSLVESTGGAALMVAPDDPAQMASAIRRVIENDSLRLELVHRGLDRVRYFSWDATAATVLRVLHEAGT